MWSRINEMECKLLQYPVGQRFKYCRIHFFCLGYCCVYINHNSDDNSQWSENDVNNCKRCELIYDE